MDNILFAIIVRAFETKSGAAVKTIRLCHLFAVTCKRKLKQNQPLEKRKLMSRCADKPADQTGQTAPRSVWNIMQTGRYPVRVHGRNWWVVFSLGLRLEFSFDICVCGLQSMLQNSNAKKFLLLCVDLFSELSDVDSEWDRGSAWIETAGESEE